jgi:phosphoglycolate phosphatase-like HAD superfamily hydrolase
MGGQTKPRLVLDFDGVICDALEECALVTWLGAHPPQRDRPVSTYLPVMPRGFRERFRTVREHSRVLAHFVVAHRPMSAHIATNARFRILFGAIADEYVRDFVVGATAARTRCRVEEAGTWLGMHTLYPGIAQLLRAHAEAVAVVTAKDADSVRAILEYHGLGDTVGEVFGETASKADAIRELCARHRLRPEQLIFVDDNLGNALQVAATGAKVRWATWGYNTAEDRALAARERVDQLSLADLPELAMA